MRRILRILAGFLSFLSLLLLLATLALWYRGRFVAGETLLVQHASDGPPWRRLMLQGWSSAGGLRLVVITEGTSTPPSHPIPGVPVHPRWTPFGERGWQSSYTTYGTGSYPLEDFMAHKWYWRGMQFCHDSDDSLTDWRRQRSITLPAWPLCLLLAISPAIWITALVRRRSVSHRRARAGLCPNCSYDLRATPRRCPECGHLSNARPR